MYERVSRGKRGMINDNTERRKRSEVRVCV